MLRVLFLNRDLEYHGGVSNVLLTLARGNVPPRAEFYFGSMMEPSAAIADAFKELEHDLVCIGDKGYLKPARQLRKLIKQKRFDFVIASSFKAGMVAKIAAAGLGCKVVHYIHAIDLVLQGKLKRKLFARVAHRDPMLFVSKAVEAAHRPADHAGPSAVVYNGVRDPFENEATRPYDQSFRSQIGIPDDALLLCFVAAFVGWKDHPTILKAFTQLDPSLNAHLLLIGKGEPGSTVEQQVADLNNPKIHLLKPRPDARRIMGAADIYVHTSRREGFGLAVVEAMLAKRPVVATREGAFVEYVEDGVTGLLADAGDAESFAKQITRLAKDSVLRERLADAGRAAALARFAPATVTAALCGYLEGITPKSPAASADAVTAVGFSNGPRKLEV